MRTGRLRIEPLVLLPFVLVQLLSFSTADAQCLIPNGTAISDPYYQPCSNDTSNPLHAICCAIGRPTAPGGVGETRDICLSNGLCQNSAKTSASASAVTSYFRDSCTDKDWNSGKCLNVCTDDVGILEMIKGLGLIRYSPASQTSNSHRAMVPQHQRHGVVATRKIAAQIVSPVIIPKSFVVGQASSTSSTAKPSSTSTHPTSSAKPASTSSHASATPSAAKDRPDAQRSKSSLGGAAIVGIVIGVLAALAIVGTAGYYFWTRRRRENAKDWPGRVSLEELTGEERKKAREEAGGTSHPTPQAVEIAPSTIRYELPGTQKPLELP